MNIYKFLDEKNKNLLSELEIDFNISFEERGNINYCEVFSKNNNCIIYFNPNIINNDSIAHELLHIKLKKYNYTISNHVFHSFQVDKSLKSAFTKFLCDHIGNCLDHKKMYSEYLEMGYSPDKFVTEGHDEKCDLKHLEKIHLKNVFGYFKCKSINMYIGCLFSIYADHINNDYQIHLNILRKKDNKLFEIITNFWMKWEKFDIKNIDAVFNSDIDLAENLINEIVNWSYDKKIK